MRENAALFIQADFGFGKIEVERAGLEAQPPDFLRQLVARRAASARSASGGSRCKIASTSL